MRLAERGRARAVIVIEPDASPVARFAAAELRAYLGRIAGAPFELRRSSAPPTEPAIAVASASSTLGRALHADDGPTDPESYLIAVDGQRVDLIGADDRGTLNAVYAFLEEDCGVVWLAAAAGHERVPRRPDLELSARSRRDRPAWPIRMLGPMPHQVANVEQFARFVDLAAKLRLNSVNLFAGRFHAPHPSDPWDEVRAALLPELEKRALWLDVGNHCWDHFLSPARYFADHPEWFSLLRGRRVATHQLCLSNEAMVAEFARNVRAYLRAHPEIRILSLFPNDAFGAHCQCERCQTVEPDEAALGLVDRIAATMRAEFPAVRFAHLTYSHAGSISYARARPGPNVVLYWADWFRCTGHGYYSPGCAVNGRLRSSLDAWRASWPNEIILFDYYTGTNHSTNMLIPLADLIADDLRQLRARGFDGVLSIFSQVQNWWTFALNLRVFARLMWRPTLDPGRVMAEWVEAAYPLSWPRILPVFERLQSLGRYEANYQRVDVARRLLAADRAGRELGGLGELDDILGTLAECQDVVAGARSGAPGELEADYLRRLAVALAYSVQRYRYVRGIVGALAALRRARRAGARADERGTALADARRSISELTEAAAATTTLLADLGDGVDGVLYPYYVRNWNTPTTARAPAVPALLERRVRRLARQPSEAPSR
jgi:hypothetical protein